MGMFWHGYRTHFFLAHFQVFLEQKFPQKIAAPVHPSRFYLVFSSKNVVYWLKILIIRRDKKPKKISPTASFMFRGSLSRTREYAWCLKRITSHSLLSISQSAFCGTIASAIFWKLGTLWDAQDCHRIRISQDFAAFLRRGNLSIGR